MIDVYTELGIVSLLISILENLRILRRSGTVFLSTYSEVIIISLMSSLLTYVSISQRSFLIDISPHHCLHSQLPFMLGSQYILWGQQCMHACVLFLTAWTMSCQAPLPMGYFRILEWIDISSSRRSSQPRKQTQASCISCVGSQILLPLSLLPLYTRWTLLNIA